MPWVKKNVSADMKSIIRLCTILGRYIRAIKGLACPIIINVTTKLIFYVHAVIDA